VPPLDLAFSPDGGLLVASRPQHRDAAVRIFVSDIEKLVVFARERVTRSLTDEECGQYLHVDHCADRD